jgi:protein-L-isoaspartate(D-aspartate) O-methyltransferase
MPIEEPMPQPMPDFVAARRAMIDNQLRPEGVTDPAVIAAMAAVPREEFVPEPVRPLAYMDRPVALGEGRFLMPPASLARLLTELAPRPGERALVVGPGNGYAAALLTHIGLDVDSQEITDRLSKASYDLILIDGAVEDVPGVLVERLAADGRLGTAIADRGVTRLAIGRSTSGSFGLRTFADAEVPILPGFSRPRAFTF